MFAKLSIAAANLFQFLHERHIKKTELDIIVNSLITHKNIFHKIPVVLNLLLIQSNLFPKQQKTLNLNR